MGHSAKGQHNILQQLAQMHPHVQNQPMPQPQSAPVPMKVPVTGSSKDGGYDVSALFQFVQTGRAQPAPPAAAGGARMLSVEDFERQLNGAIQPNSRS